MLMESAEELLKFSAGEEAEVEEVVKQLADNGVNVVVAAGKFGDLYLHFLNKYKMMGVRLTSKFDLRRLCRTVGAQAQARVVGCSAFYMMRNNAICLLFRQFVSFSFILNVKSVKKCRQTLSVCATIVCLWPVRQCLH